MAEVIQNFLVGVGYDYDEQGQNDISSGIDNIASRALQLGAVIAGAFGINALTADFAQATDTLGKFGEVFNVVPDDVAGLGRALELEGGTFDSILSQLSNLERIRAAILTGDADIFARAGITGINASDVVNAENATEAYIALADQFANLSQQQRLNAASALGFDEASIRLLSQGSEAVRDIVAQQQRLRPITEEDTRIAAEFNDELQNAQTNVGALADSISRELVPRITEATSGFNQFIDANRELIGDTLGQSFRMTVDNIGSAAGTFDTPLDIFDAISPRAAEAFQEQRAIFNRTFNTRFGEDQQSEALDQRGRSRSFGRVPTIEINLNLDGQVIDSRIIDVTDQLNQRALDDVRTSTGG